MSFGIVTASVAPVREERSKRSGLVTQLLFGELFEEEEWRDGWVRMRTGDGCAGWLEGLIVSMCLIVKINSFF